MTRRNVGFGAAILAAAFVAFAPLASAQKAFPTPDAAAAAFVDGLARNDYDQVGRVLGPDWKRFVPTETLDMDDVVTFLHAWSKSHRIVPAGDAKAYLEVGTNGWTMPIPIARSASGWRFDTRATPEELRVRRIGRNELDVIQVLLALTDAQEDYAALEGGRYATRILSSPGRRDGLYWPTVPGEPPSPLGPIAADARPGQAYHGYRYRILIAQGRDAPGGAKDYLQGGRMTGYAFLAWPAKYGDTGVMSFIVGKDGRVYQRNLGPETDRLARAIKVFDPGPGWTTVDTAP